MRKFLSVLLAFAMMLSLGVTTLAAEDTAVGTTAVEQTYAGKTVILHSNDVHGAITGYACIAALKTDYESRGAEVILVDAGDYSQGTTNVSITKGADAVAMMNAAGYDVVTIGNHEFDYGYEQLMDNMSKAEFKVVCADVFDADGTTIFDANYTYTTKSGVKVGFFGLLTPEAQTKANPALIKGLTFAIDDLWAVSQKQIDALADADVVICLSHLGVDNETKPYTSYDLWNNTKGIDMIIDGHSHTVMTKGDKNEPIQSTGTAFANIGVIVIDDASKKIESNELVAVTDTMAKDEAVAAAAEKIIDRVKAEYDVKFAVSKVELNGAKAPNGNRDSETNNGDLITDAMVWQVLQNKDGLTVNEDHVVAITNGGGIRAAIKPGDVTKNDINTVLPFGNTVAVVYVTGAELLEALEASTYCTPGAIGGFPQVSGINYTIHTGKAYDANAETYPNSTYYGPKSINRVVINSINGKEFKENEIYAVVTNNFCAAGGDTYYAFASASAQFDTGIPVDEAVMAYITRELKDEAITRLAFCQVAAKLNKMAESKTDSKFIDCADGYVMALVDAKVIDGMTENTFEPDGLLTRAQIAKIIYLLNEL